MVKRTVWLPWVVIVAVLACVGWAVRAPQPAVQPISSNEDLTDQVTRVNQHFEQQWLAEGITPAAPADELQVLRRISLALMGTIPSLEEIRQFQSDTSPDRVQRMTSRWLNDRRFADYFAARLARAFVGGEDGQFILFRRDRFTRWIGDSLLAGTPYDQLVRQMIADQGLWTGEPAVNFITAAIANDDLDRNKLAARTTRAFLGQRIDCAQCHDHPFDHWKQKDFEGLAAYFGQVQRSVVGIEDKEGEFKVQDRMTLQERTVAPGVPFLPECLPTDGTRRAQLARWITHPDNRRFTRAIANRVWGLMFGRAYMEPVDGLSDPPEKPDLLDLLAEDFRTHGHDLRRLIRVIAAARPFGLESALPDATETASSQAAEQWAMFPLVRLRPEQMIGAMLQATSSRTIDRNSHLFLRVIRFFRENEFVKEYGEPGDDELAERSGTIPQALLRLNGKLVRELGQGNPFNNVGRIATFAPDDRSCLETLFLVCLTRKPTADEVAQMLPQLSEAKSNEGEQSRGQVVEDYCWSMFNSEEFSWNH